MTRYFYTAAECEDFCNVLDSLGIVYRREFDEDMDLYIVSSIL